MFARHNYSMSYLCLALLGLERRTRIIIFLFLSATHICVSLGLSQTRNWNIFSCACGRCGCHNVCNRCAFSSQTVFPWMGFLSCDVTYSGEMRMMVSPRRKTLPIFRLISPSNLSSADSRTMLMWISNALSWPINCLPFFSSTITRLFLALFKRSMGLNASIVVTPSISLLGKAPSL